MLASDDVSTALWMAAADALKELTAEFSAEHAESLLHALMNTGDKELQERLMQLLSERSDRDSADRILSSLEERDVDFHVCRRLLEVVGKTGTKAHRSRLDSLARGRLAMYGDVIEQAKKEISRRHGRWW